jgi:hypothetical protein
MRHFKDGTCFSESDREAKEVFASSLGSHSLRSSCKKLFCWLPDIDEALLFFPCEELGLLLSD